MNGQFRDTNNIGHKTQNKDNEKKPNKTQHRKLNTGIIDTYLPDLSQLYGILLKTG
jgi:hypothetical protein